MTDEITRERLINAIFEEIDNETAQLDPPELEKQQDKYREHWINSVYSGKEHFEERENSDHELWQLIQNYKKNAFEVGFYAGMALMQKGGTV